MVHFKLKRGKKIYHIQEFASVLELARRGLISPDDPIFVPAANRWAYARCIQELRPVLREENDADHALELPPEFVEPLAGDFGGMSIEIDAGTIGVSAYADSARGEVEDDAGSSPIPRRPGDEPVPDSPFDVEEALTVPSAPNAPPRAATDLFEDAPTRGDDGWEDDIPTDPGVPGVSSGMTARGTVPSSAPAEDLWGAAHAKAPETVTAFTIPSPTHDSVWDAEPVPRPALEGPPFPSPLSTGGNGAGDDRLSSEPPTWHAADQAGTRTRSASPMAAGRSTQDHPHTGRRSRTPVPEASIPFPPGSAAPSSTVERTGGGDNYLDRPFPSREPAKGDALHVRSAAPPTMDGIPSIESPDARSGSRRASEPPPPPSFQAWVEEQARKNGAERGIDPPVIPLLTTGDVAAEPRRMLTLDPIRLGVVVGLLLLTFAAVSFYLRVTANQAFQTKDAPSASLEDKAPKAIASSAKPPATPAPVFDDAPIRAQIKPRLSPMRTFEQAEEELFIELINLKAAIADVRIEPVSGNRSRSVRTERSDVIVRLRPGVDDLEKTEITVGLVVGKYVSRKIHDGGRIRVRDLVFLYRLEDGEPLLAAKVKGETAWSYYRGGVKAQTYLNELKEGLGSAGDGGLLAR